MSETEPDAADADELYDGRTMAEPIRNAVRQFFDEHKDTTPEFVGAEDLLEVLRTNSNQTDADLELSPFSGSIEFVEPAETRPETYNRVLKLDIDGVRPPVWATHSEISGWTLSTRMPHWRLESYSEAEQSLPPR